MSIKISRHASYPYKVHPNQLFLINKITFVCYCSLVHWKYESSHVYMSPVFALFYRALLKNEYKRAKEKRSLCDKSTHSHKRQRLSEEEAERSHHHRKNSPDRRKKRYSVPDVSSLYIH